MAVRLKSWHVVWLAALFLSHATGAALVAADAAQPQHESATAADHGHESATAADHGHGDEAHPDEAGHDPAEAGGHAHAAGDGHDRDYNSPPITPSAEMARLFVFSLLMFWLFIFVARKLAWLPLIEGLDAREARVNRALAEAESARVEATRLLAEHQSQLDEITEKVKGIIAQARTDAEQEKSRIIAEAETETTAMRDQAIAEIHAAREEALSGMDDRIDNQVATAARHVLG